jgi:hypothetical protein
MRRLQSPEPRRSYHRFPGATDTRSCPRFPAWSAQGSSEPLPPKQTESCAVPFPAAHGLIAGAPVVSLGSPVRITHAVGVQLPRLWRQATSYAPARRNRRSSGSRRRGISVSRSARVGHDEAAPRLPRLSGKRYCASIPIDLTCVFFIHIPTHAELDLEVPHEIELFLGHAVVGLPE